MNLVRTLCVAAVLVSAPAAANPPDLTEIVPSAQPSHPQAPALPAMAWNAFWSSASWNFGQWYAPDPPPGPLFDITPMFTPRPQLPPAWVTRLTELRELEPLRWRVFDVDVPALVQAMATHPDGVSLQVFPDTRVDLVSTGFFNRATYATWLGRERNAPSSRINLTRAGKATVGRADIGGAHYRIVSLDPDTIAIVHYAAAPEVDCLVEEVPSAP